MGHTLANRYVYGKAKSNLRASIGLRSISKRVRQRVNPGNTGRYQNMGEHRQGKTITTEWAL